MPDINYQRPYLYPAQETALFTPKRYALVEASTKSGKTVGCLVWIAEQALGGKSGQNYWWVAPSHFQAKIAFTRLVNGLTPGTFEPNRSDLYVTMLNGTIIWFKTGEIPDKLYGEDVWAAVVDEASRVREDAWTALRSTLTATRGRVRLIGNVRGRKNWFYRMCRQAEAGHPDMAYSKLTVDDAVAAGVFPAEEAQDARERLSESAYQELYMAEPSDDGGNPFGGDEAIEACEIPKVKWDRQVQCWGWDLAKSVDWTVGIGLDENGSMCRFYRWQKQPWRETIAQIKTLTGSTPALVDATGVGDPIVEELQRAEGGAERNIQGFKFSQTSKQQLMEGLAVGVQSQLIEFTRNPTGNEMRNFEYTYTRTGVLYSAMEGFHDDCVVSLALAYKLHRPPARAGFINRALAWIPPVHLPIFAR